MSTGFLTLAERREIAEAFGWASIVQDGPFLSGRQPLRAEDGGLYAWTEDQIVPQYCHETLNYVREVKRQKLKLDIRLERSEDIPAFGGFLRCEDDSCDVQPTIILNVEACLSPEADSDSGPVALSREERKALLITTLMHEFGHALEAHFKVPVNEGAIEQACQAWEKVYWERKEAL